MLPLLLGQAGGEAGHGGEAWAVPPGAGQEGAAATVFLIGQDGGTVTSRLTSLLASGQDGGVATSFPGTGQDGTGGSAGLAENGDRQASGTGPDGDETGRGG